jgi:hypothetical protein
MLSLGFRNCKECRLSEDKQQSGGVVQHSVVGVVWCGVVVYSVVWCALWCEWLVL